MLPIFRQLSENFFIYIELTQFRYGLQVYTKWLIMMTVFATGCFAVLAKDVIINLSLSTRGQAASVRPGAAWNQRQIGQRVWSACFGFSRIPKR